MPAWPFLPASRTALGSPCEESNRHFRNAVCFENHKHLKISCKTVSRPRDAVASVVLLMDRNSSATSGYVQTVWRTGRWGIYDTWLLFPIGLLVTIEYYLSLMISKPRRTQDAQTRRSTMWRIWRESSNFAPCSRTTPTWLWISCSAVRESTVSGQIPSAISLHTRLNPGPRTTGSWSLPMILKLSTSRSYWIIWCVWSCCPSSSSWTGRRSLVLRWRMSRGRSVWIIYTCLSESSPRPFVWRPWNRGTRIFFNTAENMNYVGPAPDVSYYDVDQMLESERKEFRGTRPRRMKCSTTDECLKATARPTWRCCERRAGRFADTYQSVMWKCCREHD